MDENNPSADVTFSLNLPINSLSPSQPQNSNQTNSNQTAQTNSTSSPKNSNQTDQSSNQTNSPPSQSSNQTTQNSNQTMSNQTQSIPLISIFLVKIALTSYNFAQAVQILSQQYSFPKVLLLYTDMYVTKDKISQIYYLESIDYMDSLTSNPISYYVYIQQMDIIQDRNYPNDESANNTFFTFQSIGKNNLDVTS